MTNFRKQACSLGSMRKLLLIFLLAFSFQFQGKSQDVGISSIISPVNGCNIGWDTIRTYLYNFSAFPVGGTFNISYSVNGGTWTTESILTSIGPNASYLFNFSTFYNFDTSGTYTVCCAVSLLGDVNPNNDTICISVVNDTTVIGGSITGPSVVCASANSGVLVLSGYNNSIAEWQYSTDGGSTWTSTPDDSASYTFSNVPQQTIYQVLIDGGYCPDDFSGQFTLDVDQPSVGGTLSGTASVCSGVNSGTLLLTGQTGDTIFWQYNTGSPPWTILVNDTTYWDYLNLTTTTNYQAVVQNGVCPPALSNIITITVTPPSIGGNVTGGTTTCLGSNGGNLVLAGSQGNILNWIWSNDGGSSWLPPIANSSATQPYLNLTDTTIYCAVVQSPGCPPDTSACDTIYVVDPPVPNAGIDDTIYIYDQTQLNASGGLYYNWSPTSSLSDPNISNPIASPVTTTVYTVTVTNGYGCYVMDDVTIFVVDTTVKPAPTTIIVANYVSLNNDGYNDVWNVINLEFYPDNEVMVFNNQGEIVFEQSNYTNTWAGTYNGNQLPDGTYFYVVKVPALNFTGKGTLTITSK